jgi:hypothetical protein
MSVEAASFGFLVLSFHLCIALSLVAVSPAVAQTGAPAAQVVQGTLNKSSTEGLILEVSTDTGQRNLRIFAAASITSDLNKLKTGDGLVARGAIDANGRSLNIQSIESVGLRELLGSWHGPQREVFEFADFSRLNLYAPGPVGGESSKESADGPTAGHYHYVLAPEAGRGYSIFMSDNTTVHLGSIVVTDAIVHLTVFDSKTGQISESISLKR